MIKLETPIEIITKIDIDGINFDYYIGNMGNVYNSNMEPIHQWTDKKGYYRVDLYYYDENNKKRSKNYLVHRLVALAYIPNPGNLKTVNHLHVIPSNDETSYVDKSDNRWFMLEWASYSQNNQHAIDNKLRIPLNCEDHQNATLSNEQVERICQLLQDGWLYEDIIKELKLNNIDNIRRKLIMIKTGNSWTKISDRYNFSDRRREVYVISDDQVHKVCKMLQNKITDYSIILKEIQMDNTRSNRKIISTIKCRKKHTRISKYYNW